MKLQLITENILKRVPPANTSNQIKTSQHSTNSKLKFLVIKLHPMRNYRRDGEGIWGIWWKLKKQQL